MRERHCHKNAANDDGDEELLIAHFLVFPISHNPLIGEWVNDLGSIMIIDPSTDVSFNSQYETKLWRSSLCLWWGL